MIAFLTKWLEHRRSKRAAIDAAVKYFEATTGAQAHADRSCVIAEKAGQFIVRVGHGYGKPPGRAWFLIGPDGSVVRRLCFEEVERFGERVMF